MRAYACDAASPKLQGDKAEAPNEVWSWDITYTAAAIRGSFYRLYMVEDIFSRKIVDWEVHEDETTTHASALISKTCLAEGGYPWRRPHAALSPQWPDEGRNHAGDLATSRCGVAFSRPSVSGDNPSLECLFRTLKYTPAYRASRSRAWQRT